MFFKFSLLAGFVSIIIAPNFYLLILTNLT
jgi:hypothetical protein